VIEFDGGIRIKGTQFWLDATKVKDVCFVSHAHSDHTARHGLAIVSDTTASLYRYRVGDCNLMIVPFNKLVEIGSVRVTLFPAGHILGSSQILMELNGKRVVYSGDLKVIRNEVAESIEIRPCDVLIMECTYGDPRYVFPDREKVVNQLTNFVERTFESGHTPVVLAYSMGKAQEAIKILGDLGYSMRVHKGIYEIANIYRELGVKLSNYRRFPPHRPSKDVIILPPYAKDFPSVRPIRKKTAILTGWAVDRNACSRFGVDEAIPLSDHADYVELVGYVLSVKPKKVYTIHGSPKFASILRKRGINARHLEGVYHFQLGLWDDL
jgi:putative mRNA 3-end processing factor